MGPNLGAPFGPVPPGPIPRIWRMVTADALHFTPGREGWDAPDCIFWHSTSGTDSRLWLSTTSPPDNPVSIHKLIRPEGVYSIVAPSHTAYHAGWCAYPDGTPFPHANARSLGVEIENRSTGVPGGPVQPYTDADYNALAHTTAGWMVSYGIPIERVYLHRDMAVYPPDDPRAGQHGRRHDPAGLDVDRAKAETLAWYSYMQTLTPLQQRFVII